MGAEQRKTAFPVYVVDIVNDPGFRCVASPAIGTDRLVVYICMTIGTFRPGIGENQRNMALAAIQGLVLPGERKRCFIVVECIDILVQFPSFGAVAQVTTV